MKKVLLAVLIIITGLKIIGNRDDFACKHFIIKPAAQDEESKSENEENKHSKRYNEDICYSNAEVNSSAQMALMSASSLFHQKPYFGFTDKPSTPPPDLM